jgi:hypothetical protein
MAGASHVVTVRAARLIVVGRDHDLLNSSCAQLPRVAGQITQEMWSRKSHEWEAELEAIRLQTGRHEKASRDYTVTGSRVLELAKQAHSLFVRQSSEEQARLLKTLLSNCTFDRGSLSATYSKPFDMLVEGNVSGDWLGGRDSNPDNGVQSAVSYR